MKTHIENLKEHIPDLESKKVLDLGSGKGSFIIELAKRGGNVKGVEVSQGYIDETLKRAKEAGVSVQVIQGFGESIPFFDAAFDFVNMSEVIEHVNDPRKVMSEVARVLVPGGKVYISAPTRFSLKDPHFHLYFVNWLPRSMSDRFISLFGKHKDYSVDTGKQRLTELHYYTNHAAVKLFSEAGFLVEDIRKIKINKRFKNVFIRSLIKIIYHLISPWYFDSHHYLLTKI